VEFLLLSLMLLAFPLSFSALRHENNCSPPREANDFFGGAPSELYDTDMGENQITMRVEHILGNGGMQGAEEQIEEKACEAAGSCFSPVAGLPASCPWALKGRCGRVSKY